jgi:hypothetical protein
MTSTEIIEGYKNKFFDYVSFQIESEQSFSEEYFNSLAKKYTNLMCQILSGAIINCIIESSNKSLDEKEILKKEIEQQFKKITLSFVNDYVKDKRIVFLNSRGNEDIEYTSVFLTLSDLLSTYTNELKKFIEYNENIFVHKYFEKDEEMSGGFQTCYDTYEFKFIENLFLVDFEEDCDENNISISQPTDYESSYRKKNAHIISKYDEVDMEEWNTRKHALLFMIKELIEKK